MIRAPAPITTGLGIAADNTASASQSRKAPTCGFRALPPGMDEPAGQVLVGQIAERHDETAMVDIGLHDSPAARGHTGSRNGCFEATFAAFEYQSLRVIDTKCGKPVAPVLVILFVQQRVMAEIVGRRQRQSAGEEIGTAHGSIAILEQLDRVESRP